MADSTSDGHKRPELGTYLLGKADAAERTRIERHLALCRKCRAECESLTDVVECLVMLSADDRRAIAEEFGVPAQAPVARERRRSASGWHRWPGPDRSTTPAIEVGVTGRGDETIAITDRVVARCDGPRYG
jgi:anti-sigma factor RsiW